MAHIVLSILESLKKLCRIKHSEYKLGISMYQMCKNFICLEHVAIFDAVKTGLNNNILAAAGFDAEYFELRSVITESRRVVIASGGLGGVRNELIKRVEHAPECKEWAHGLASKRAKKLQQI
ncbi:hypothetical protein BDP27DRAFT_1361411 [Rhodocollybia butyracea]|uniref:Uncharacterized protein n=1 Tax=Rhodocollybia butyracea TaxID=206335 RepID=A0A9P5UAG1_9AGAR|nr:hypothetical protein BDP27DRAFT_1361411 [Rhodocollybia butyracea]